MKVTQYKDKQSKTCINKLKWQECIQVHVADTEKKKEGSKKWTNLADKATNQIKLKQYIKFTLRNKTTKQGIKSK